MGQIPFNREKGQRWQFPIERLAEVWDELLYSSYQRPGAACKCTVDEFLAAAEVEKGYHAISTQDGSTRDGQIDIRRSTDAQTTTVLQAHKITACLARPRRQPPIHLARVEQIH